MIHVINIFLFIKMSFISLDKNLFDIAFRCNKRKKKSYNKKNNLSISQSIISNINNKFNVLIF